MTTKSPNTSTLVMIASKPRPHPEGIKRNKVYADEGREGREVTLTLWYSAESSAGALGERIADAAPDLNGTCIKASHAYGVGGRMVIQRAWLAVVDRPIFLISAKDDEINIFELEATVLYE